MFYSGYSPWEPTLPSSTAGPQLWRNSTSPFITSPEKARCMLMVWAGCRWNRHLPKKRKPLSLFNHFLMRLPPVKQHESYIMPLTWVLRHSGNSSGAYFCLLGASGSVPKLQGLASSVKLALTTVLRGKLLASLNQNVLGTLSIDWRMEYMITFVDCYSKYTILIPSKDHTVMTVSNVLLDWVVPYFGVPGRLLSDGGENLREKCGMNYSGL